MSNCGVACVCLQVILVVMSRVHLPPDSRLSRWAQQPHIAHLLVVLHSIGVVVPRSLQREHLLPTATNSEATTGVHSVGGRDTNAAPMGYLDIAPSPLASEDGDESAGKPETPAPEFTTFRGEWYLSGGVKPPPLLVDLGDVKPRKLNFLTKHKVVHLTKDEHNADIRFVRLHKTTDLQEAEDTNRLVFWTSCAFTDLSPITRATLRDTAIETGITGDGPSAESIMCNIIMRQLHIESSRILTGPLRWQSKDFRKTARDRESDFPTADNQTATAVTG